MINQGLNKYVVAERSVLLVSIFILSLTVLRLKFNHFSSFNQRQMAAAMKAKLATMITLVESKEQWDEILANVGGRLMFIDVHKNWCGECTVIRPTLEKIFLEVEGIDNRAQFLSLNEKSGVEHPALQEFLDSESCKPRFIGLINGNVVANVEGALSPAIVSAVMDNLPEID